MNPEYDVVIAGGGPAGSALARHLALAGRRVLVVERSAMEAPRLGESLGPSLRSRLVELGLWSRFLASAPLPSWGTRSIWGHSAEQVHSHLTSPWGNGWHVDRCALDRMLLDAAREAGATVCSGLSVARCTFSAGRWRVGLTETDTGTSRPPLAAHVLVDATGRRAAVARRLGARLVPFDRLVGIHAAWEDTPPVEGGHVGIEAAPEGWWYTAPAGRRRRVVMLMTDADLCTAEQLTRPTRWRLLLEQTIIAAETLRWAPPAHPPRVAWAGSHRMTRRDLDASWLAVGDAALAVDPVSGSGVVRALKSAETAARTVEELLARSGDRAATLRRHEREHDRLCSEYLFERAGYYGIEQRFSSSPFWSRRLQSGMTARG